MRIMALAGALVLLGVASAQAQTQPSPSQVQAAIQAYQSSQGGAAGATSASSSGASATSGAAIAQGLTTGMQSSTVGATAGQASLSTGATAAQNAISAIQGYVTTTDNVLIPVFGANMFTGTFSGTRPADRPDYMIQPGDQVVVNLFGAVFNGGTFPVDATGTIFVTGIGPIHVGGIQASQLHNTVKAAVSRIFTNAVGVYTAVSQAGTIGVFVSGKVTKPGRYIGGPHDSVMFYLQQAGGVDQTRGSLRNIEVLRNGQLMEHVDLYDFLLNGQVQPFVFQDGDVIFDEPRGAMVGVTGPVENAFAFEAPAGSKRMTGADLLPLVRVRPSVTGSVVHGIRNGQPRSAFFGLPDLSRVVLTDGDHVDFRSDQFIDTVTVSIEGNVPGQKVFVLPRGTTLSQLLAKIPMQGTAVAPQFVHLRRSSVATQQKQAIQDALYRLQEDILTAAPLTAQAAALTTAQAGLINQFVTRAESVQPDGNIAVHSNGQFQDLLLQDGDTVVLPDRTDVVIVAGEVLNPGGLAHANGLTIKGYIDRAGGFATNANKKHFVLRHLDGSAVEAGPKDHPLAGDEIAVLPKVGVRWFQLATDISQLIFQLAVTSGTVVNLTK